MISEGPEAAVRDGPATATGQINSDRLVLKYPSAMTVRFLLTAICFFDI
jgi:hypothetical protein